jgi:DNA-binding MarR family transcriptional regulator
MDNGAWVHAVLFHANMRPNERLMLLAIAGRARGGDKSPSMDELAEDTGLARATARAAIHRLRDGGWLTWESRRNSGGEHRSNVYTITPKAKALRA